MAIELVNRNKSLEFQKDKTNLSFTAPMGGGAVRSVNEKTGHVVLTADDVGALSKDTIIPSVDGLASEEYVDNAVNSIDIPSIDGLATEEYVNEAISNIDIPEGEQVQVDWAQNDETAKDYVKNRPFYYEDVDFLDLIEISFTEDDFLESYEDGGKYWLCYEKYLDNPIPMPAIKGKTLVTNYLFDGVSEVIESLAESNYYFGFSDGINYFIDIFINEEEDGFFISGAYLEIGENTEEVTNHSLSFSVKERIYKPIEKQYLTNTTRLFIAKLDDYEMPYEEVINNVSLGTAEKDYSKYGRVVFVESDNSLMCSLPNEFVGVKRGLNWFNLSRTLNIGEKAFYTVDINYFGNDTQDVVVFGIKTYEDTQDWSFMLCRNASNNTTGVKNSIYNGMYISETNYIYSIYSVFDESTNKMRLTITRVL